MKTPRLRAKIHLTGWLLSVVAIAGGFALAASPVQQWWWCWSSSVLLMLASLTGFFFAIPTDVPRREQTMRPWFLVNVIFCGYTFLTSIFYWLEIQGFSLLSNHDLASVEALEIELAARAQVYYLVGHVGFLLGLGVCIGWRPKHQWEFHSRMPIATVLLWLSIVSFIATLGLSLVPGLAQVAVRAKGTLTIAAGVSLGFAFRERSIVLGPALAVNVVLAILALASGWKEEVLVLVILHSITFYPAFPRLTTLISSVIIFFGFVVLPPISGTVRQQSWKGSTGKFAALRNALEVLQNKSAREITDESWMFLTGRLSEIGLFTRYLRTVPDDRPFYGTQILLQSALTPVPRILWPDKQSTEELVRQRVIENKVVSELSDVSAKPQFIVDGYLTYGALGVFLGTLCFGALAQIASTFCESRLGGIVMGGVMFNGLFSIFWRGNCWEFFTNGVFWSFVIAGVASHLFAGQGLLVRRRIGASVPFGNLVSRARG